MKIRNNNVNLNFGSVYTTVPAEKLLKKADKAVKATKATYVDINIPDGHRMPLWSVLSKVLIERQAANKNNIVIDIAEDNNRNLLIKTLDSKGFKHKEWTVSPYPVTGSLEELFDSEVVILGKSKSPVVYGKSNFFDVIDSAEFDVDSMNALDRTLSGEVKTSLKTLPKDELKQEQKVLKRKESLYRRIVPHLQRPFANLKKMLSQSLRHKTEHAVTKEHTDIEKLPRKMKKAAKKLHSTNQYKS